MPTCDIFCKVIDNYGDAGIAWRLAYGLSDTYGYNVRLYIDDLTPLVQLAPDYRETKVQVYPSPLSPTYTSPLKGEVGGGVGEGGEPSGATGEGVKNTTSPTRPAALVDLPLKGGGDQVADLVIECLGAEVPETYVQALVDRTRTGARSIWLRYEYLTAEDWAADVHLKPSLHPQFPDLKRYFFVPGFKDGTGGVLFDVQDQGRAGALPPPSAYAKASADRKGEGRGSVTAKPARATPDGGLQSINPKTVTPPLNPLPLGGGNPTGSSVLVFSYGHPELKEFYGYLTSRGVRVDVPPGAAASQAGLPPTVPWRPQDELDRAFFTYDYVFVRGEDSITQAVAAGTPAVWQIYPQDDNAHHVKLQAFLDWYLDGLEEQATHATRALYHAWNFGDGPVVPAFTAWLAHLPALTSQARKKAAEVRARGLALQNLVDFYQTIS